MNETIQLINSAIVKGKNVELEADLQEQMNEIAQSPVINVLGKAIKDLAAKEKISTDLASYHIVSTLKKLDHIWNQYLLLEGSERLKEVLESQLTD